LTLIDTHVHVWDLSMFPYTWTKGMPLLSRSFTIEEYDEATRTTGISKAVLVEADVDEPSIADEARLLLAMANRHEHIAAVVASGRPESDGFAAYLDEICGDPKLKGIRRVLHTQPDGLADSPAFAKNVRRLEKYGLSFDICVLDSQLPSAIQLTRECPGIQFILDHSGCPQPKGKGFDVWSQRIAEIASFPNVVCKISGLVGYTGHHDWSIEDVRPRVQWVIQCFGWDRVMFGSDWPVCTLSSCPKEWTDVVRAITHGASEANCRKLFSDNAERVYRL
jgi:predicted TIM-barrel fold metal-dependent hydrolase